MKLTKIEIINETISYYSEDVNRRGLSKTGNCVYLSEDGTMCAVGRCLKEPEKFRNLEEEINILLREGKTHNINDLLKEKYTGHNQLFWEDLQMLHDNNYYWNSDGLTNGGKSKTEELLEKYADKNEN